MFSLTVLRRANEKQHGMKWSRMVRVEECVKLSKYHMLIIRVVMVESREYIQRSVNVCGSGCDRARNVLRTSIKMKVKEE